MTTDLGAACAQLRFDAEIDRITAVLGICPSRDSDVITGLRALPADDIRTLRTQISSEIDSRRRQALAGVARASAVLPSRVLVAIARVCDTPAFTAGLAAMIQPQRARHVAARLDVAELADIASNLSSRDAAELLTHIPAPTLQAVAAELSTREDWIALGTLVSGLDDEVIESIIDVLSDVALLQSVRYLDPESATGRIVGLCPAYRMPSILDTVAERHMWSHFAVITAHSTTEQTAEIVGHLTALSPSAADLVRATIALSDTTGPIMMGE